MSGCAVSSGPLLRYYAPLRDWLEREIDREGIPIGWTTEGNI